MPHATSSLRRYLAPPARTLAAVLANPGDSAVTFALPRPMQLVQPSGGGAVPSDGRLPSSWQLRETTVTSVALQPQSGALLLD